MAQRVKLYSWNAGLMSSLVKVCSFRLRPWPFSQGRIYCVRGRWPHILRFNKVMADSQGLRGPNLKIWCHGEVRWYSFWDTAFRKGPWPHPMSHNMAQAKPASRRPVCLLTLVPPGIAFYGWRLQFARVSLPEQAEQSSARRHCRAGTLVQFSHSRHFSSLS